MHFRVEKRHSASAAQFRNGPKSAFDHLAGIVHFAFKTGPIWVCALIVQSCRSDPFSREFVASIWKAPLSRDKAGLDQLYEYVCCTFFILEQG